MSVLSCRYRINQLLDQRAEYRKRQQQIKQELTDLQRYATNISDGGISIAELMRTPSSMYNRQLLYMHGAANYSQMSAQNQMQQLMMTPYYQQMMKDQTPEVQTSYQQLMYQNFYKQSQSQFSKYEASLLADKQKALSEEDQSIKESLEAIEAELGDAKHAVQKGIGEIFGGKA